MLTVQELTKMKKIVRYEDKQGNPHYGTVENDTISQLSSGFHELLNNELQYDSVQVHYQNVNILAPVVPSKVINFGWTYPGHAIETGGTANLKEPFLFLKPNSSIVADQTEIILPPKNLTNQVEMEGELALIVGKRGKNITQENAMSHIFGCTIFNDITARDLTKKDPQFTRGKGFDTFGPLGPYIVTGIDPTNLRIITTLNGKVVQDGNTNQMSLSIPFLISWISKVMTLEPGDVIATGSPSGSCAMESGDVIVVEIEGIGKLSNIVTSHSADNSY